MKPDHNKKLEEAIHRRLARLPDLQASERLASRVMAAIEQRTVLPWYRRPWQAWPIALQAASLTLLVAFSAGLCFGSWKLSETESVVVATRQIGEWFSMAGVIWNLLSGLPGSLVLLLKQLNPILLTVCAAMAFLSYAACVGLGTAFFRYAFVRRQENHL